jgi:hypothetical protein
MPKGDPGLVRRNKGSKVTCKRTLGEEKAVGLVPVGGTPETSLEIADEMRDGALVTEQAVERQAPQVVPDSGSSSIRDALGDGLSLGDGEATSVWV